MDMKRLLALALALTVPLILTLYMSCTQSEVKSEFYNEEGLLVRRFFYPDGVTIERERTYLNDSILHGYAKDFYPNGYEFFHSKKELDNYVNRNKRTKTLGQKLLTLNFDFDKYSYCVFYGRKVKKLYHSYKSTLLDDLSASYIKYNKKTLVFVEYEKDDNEKGIFIYKIKKNTKLRGFYGI